MQTFVNAFDVAINNDKTEVIINFSQVSPIMNDDHEIADTQVFPVANLVMTGQDAHRLLAILSDVL